MEANGSGLGLEALSKHDNEVDNRCCHKGYIKGYRYFPRLPKAPNPKPQTLKAKP